MNPSMGRAPHCRHFPAALIGRQRVELGQVILRTVGRDHQPRAESTWLELCDLKEIDRVIDHGFVQRDVPLNDDSVIRGFDFHAGPAIEVGLAVLLEAFPHIFRLDLLGFVSNNLNIFLGNAPGPQSVDGTIDEADIALHVLDVLPEVDGGDRLGFGVGRVQNLTVELVLQDGVDEVVFLVADVDRIKRGQQVALGDAVARTQLSGCRHTGSTDGRVFLDLADFDHSR